MSRKTFICVFFATMLLFVSQNAGVGFGATLLVDDDGLDCPAAVYQTILGASADAQEGDTIEVCAGTYAGVIVEKTLHFRARGNVVINDGPISHVPPAPFLRAGFLFEEGGAGSGSSIRGFRFEGQQQFDYVDDGFLDFPIFSRGADNITVKYNVMVNSLQAISNWHGSGWRIYGNRIEGLWVLCGGGIGILIGSNDGTPANNNKVLMNRIAADVSPDCNFYTTSGIALYSDTRKNRAGGPIEGNVVIFNKARVTGTWTVDSDTGEVIPAADGFEITDGGLLAEDDFTGDGEADVTGNIVAYNYFRGSTIEMDFSPEEAKLNNIIKRQLGEADGHDEDRWGRAPKFKLDRSCKADRRRIFHRRGWYLQDRREHRYD